MLLEHLVPLAEGRFLALTLGYHLEHEPPDPVGDLAYARVVSADGSATDCLALVVEPIRTAKPVKPAQAAAAGQQLPQYAWALGADRVLLGYRRPQEPHWYREVCLRTARELDRFDGDALAKAIPRPPKGGSNKGKAPDAAHNVDEIEAMLFASGRIGIKTKVLAASPHGMLVDAATRRLFMRRADGKFAIGEGVHDMRGLVATACEEGFIVEIEPERGARSLVRLGATPGPGPSAWPRGKAQASSLASASHWLAIGGYRNELALLDTRSDRIERLPPFIALGKDDAPEVRLSPDARYVAAFLPYEAKPLGVLDRESGRSALLQREAHDQAGRQARHAGFALVDSGLATLARGALSITPWEQLPWAGTAAPAKKPTRKSTPEATLEAELAKGPLRPHSALIRSWYAPGVALKPKRKRGDLPVGASKFNGDPDLPAGAAWPRCRGLPMAFLAQLDLAQAHAAVSGLLLPNAGLLSFFLGIDPEPGLPSFQGEVNFDRGGARVLYSAAGTTLARLAPPSDTPAEYLDSERPTCELKFVRGGAVLPEQSSPLVARAGVAPAAAAAYEALADALNGNRESELHWGSRLGGHPAILQNDDLGIVAELRERGLSEAGDAHSVLRDPAFIDATTQWRQVLQMAEGAEGWGWGDSGLMHWMARGGAFANAAFPTAWAIGVCH
jgi:hypothetical protein